MKFFFINFISLTKTWPLFFKLNNRILMMLTIYYLEYFMFNFTLNLVKSSFIIIKYFV